MENSIALNTGLITVPKNLIKFNQLLALTKLFNFMQKRFAFETWTEYVVDNAQILAKRLQECVNTEDGHSSMMCLPEFQLLPYNITTGCIPNSSFWVETI